MWDRARRQVADLLGCATDDLIFTSGGTEANNHAIKGVAYAYRERGNHIITSAVEHPAVTEVCRYLESQGFRVTYLPVDEYGLVDAGQVEEALTDETILVSIMHANNEVGTIEPVAEIAAAAHRRGALAHTDCAQSVGKIPVKVDDLGVDLLSIAGHKLYAPKGIGALYSRPGVRLEKLMHGANHEQNRRAGTENVIEMAGLGMACELIERNLADYASHMREMRDRLERGLPESGHKVRVNGHPEKRLPNTASVSFRGVEADRILADPAHGGRFGRRRLPQRPGGSVPRAGGDADADGVCYGYAALFGRPLYSRSEEIDRAVAEICGVVKDLAVASSVAD